MYVLDPMLATGGTLVAAIQELIKRGADDVTAVVLLAAPEGVEVMERELAGTPVTVVTASVDERLNEHGYIVPGLGDAGDRMYGTAVGPAGRPSRPRPRPDPDARALGLGVRTVRCLAVCTRVRGCPHAAAARSARVRAPAGVASAARALAASFCVGQLLEGRRR